MNTQVSASAPWPRAGVGQGQWSRSVFSSALRQALASRVTRVTVLRLSVELGVHDYCLPEVGTAQAQSISSSERSFGMRNIPKEVFAMHFH